VKALQAFLESDDEPITQGAYGSSRPRAGRGDLEENAAPCIYADTQRSGGDARDTRVVCTNKKGGIARDGSKIGYGRNCPYEVLNWFDVDRNCRNYRA